MITADALDALKKRALKLYQGWWDQTLLFIDDKPKLIRHEDPQLGGSGYWMTVDVFIPDEIVTERRP